MQSVFRRIWIIKAGLIVLGLVSLVACGTARTGDIQNYEDLNRLVNSGEFQIENDWANPIGGTNINLIGNTNYIRFKKDSVEIFLPYFGVRHTGGGYGNTGGIKYDGLSKNMEINKKPEKKKVEISFDGTQDGENLEFYISLFSNGNTTTSVNSSQRSSISYQGNLSSLEEEE
ncbi:DUF4251 domain-containing protein [Gramella sp. KN1008]|uniref:DUF4251 domain-containing protein n=1 Tax=Gramella sp. KN1008 TaxID=2529298 RepID=UPI001039A80D|nr:DUF4251 domain-containing protein [Gramella sp. KN1008]TBW29200.1 DUF4251 domain-containing protein [Gramella sp. KN1008]